MITFTNLGVNGRLGNQLFQYAALKGLALKNSYEVKIPDLKNQSWHGQKCLLTEFNLECEYLNENDKILYQYHEPDWRNYDNDFFNLPDGVDINGYFQSIFYFSHAIEQIKKELTPKDLHLQKAKNFIQTLKNKHNSEIVSVHVRRGDNMLNGQTDLIKAFDENGAYQIYFEKAKEIFSNKNVTFLVFTGGQRWTEDNSEDLNWCKKFFKGENFIFSESSSTIDDFCRIMSCDHNILSHASSFGWWAAFVNKNPNKKVVAPEYYNPELPNHIRNMFYPDYYILK